MNFDYEISKICLLQPAFRLCKPLVGQRSEATFVYSACLDFVEYLFIVANSNTVVKTANAYLGSTQRGNL